MAANLTMLVVNQYQKDKLQWGRGVSLLPATGDFGRVLLHFQEKEAYFLTDFI